MENLEQLKEWCWQSDNRACFIERERILNRLEREMEHYREPDRGAKIFATLMREVSTPVFPCDYFAGRLVEALPDTGMESVPNNTLALAGHMSPDYEWLLRLGLQGILKEIQTAAAQKGDATSLAYAHEAFLLVEAVRDYTARYAAEAERCGKTRMAEALRHVPMEPAYDFYSALQSIWLIHMILSTYLGARDFAFGRFDQYMLPFYEQALQNGETEESLTELLAGFFVKCNEICGRATHNHACKPIRSNASKQYINIGGETPNRFSHLVLDAAVRVNMAQPQIVVLLKPEADAEFTAHVFRAMSVLTDKVNLYNFNTVSSSLMQNGVPEAIAKDCTYSACCTLDLNHHTRRREYYIPAPQLFLKTLHSAEYHSVAEILTAFTEALRSDCQSYVDGVQNHSPTRTDTDFFLFASMFHHDSATLCRYPCDPDTPFHLLNLFFPGVATIGDSLLVLDRLVFQEKRYSYSEFMQILEQNFVGYERLRQEIQNLTRFGNDTPADAYAADAGNAFLAAVDQLQLHPHFYVSPGFYSLERDNTWCEYDTIGATPDGRKFREPFSENQSPSYGADKNGITALLNSISKLPLDKTGTGGLNLTFSQAVSPEILQALAVSFFQNGGLHIGISVFNRETLLDAMAHPERHKSLTVRLYGFSEYFISLPEWQQLAVLNRTAYSC